MKPDEQNQSQGGGGLQPGSSRSSIPHREAAANVIRHKIDSLYGDRPVADEPAQQPTQSAVEQQPVENSNPYMRQHNPTPLPEEDEWKAYHSAWQNYYQKYYESYYTHQISKTTQQSHAAAQVGHRYFDSADSTLHEDPIEDEPISKDEALFTLRQRLLARVRDSAQTVRKSRHFIPIISAISVVLIFVFIQYNSFFIATVAAYISPGAIERQNIVINPDTDIVVSDEPRLIIPKINVDVPVHYDVGADYDSQMDAMKTGVAHFSIPGASSHPGEIGNTVIAGHSSNDLFDSGDYKFIFAQLERLQKGDTIYANYKGTRYTYVVTKKEVVQPTDVDALIYKTSKPVLTLLTCTPLGTSLNRLLVIAEQVSPDPNGAKETPASEQPDESNATLPGNQKTLFEKLFGIGD